MSTFENVFKNIQIYPEIIKKNLNKKKTKRVIKRTHNQISPQKRKRNETDE